MENSSYFDIKKEIDVSQQNFTEKSPKIKSNESKGTFEDNNVNFDSKQKKKFSETKKDNQSDESSNSPIENKDLNWNERFSMPSESSIVESSTITQEQSFEENPNCSSSEKDKVSDYKANHCEEINESLFEDFAFNYLNSLSFVRKFYKIDLFSENENQNLNRLDAILCTSRSFKSEIKKQKLWRYNFNKKMFKIDEDF